MLIAIPSKGRPGAVKSQSVIPAAKVYVPELEAEAYERAGTKNVVPVPNSVWGITATRNWILDHATHPRVVMIDDDVKEQGWAHAASHSWKKHKLNQSQWFQEWEKLFDVTMDVGFRIWGVATTGECRAIYPYRPFLWHTYVTASCMGMFADNPLRFDESFQVKEDYEICLRCLKEDGGIVGARHVYWQNDHWEKAGGCRAYRTQHMEEDAIRRLIKMYPGMIRRVMRGGSEFSIQLDF
jgi:hypothetical protein